MLRLYKKLRSGFCLVLPLLIIAWSCGGYWLVGWSMKQFDPKYTEYRAKVEKLNKVKVYVTPAGTRYHREYHYGSRNRPIPLGDAITKSGYFACMVCKPYNPGEITYKKPRWIDLSSFLIWCSGLVLLFRLTNT